MAMDIRVTEKLDDRFASGMIRKRLPDTHKGTYGRVLIVAGGSGMTGSAVLASLAALRTGSGLVYVCTPKANHPVVQTLVPEAICVDWDEAISVLSGTSRSGRNIHYDAVAFGPGVGLSQSVRRRMKALFLTYDGPVVLDADGLNMLAGDEELRDIVRDYLGGIVLTPHAAEAARLLEGEGATFGSDREYTAFSLSWAFRQMVVLKGNRTLVCRTEPGGEEGGRFDLAENTTGNPGMATAGSGDVLTGVIASLLGQGLSLWDASRTGVFLHGRAGDLAAEEKGEYGLIARDLCEKLPYAIQPFERQRAAGKEGPAAGPGLST